MERLDAMVAKWAARHVEAMHVPWLRRVTELGGTEVVASVAVAVGAITIASDRSLRRATYLAAVIGGQTALYNALKRLTNRSRPGGPYHAGWTGPSFPSGHTATATASWPAIEETLTSSVSPISRLAGPAVGATRVLLGVHWLSDVVAGWALGFGWRKLLSPLRRWALG